MRKPALVNAVAKTTGLSLRKSDDAVAATFEHITNALARGEAVKLMHFGAFTVKSRAARKGHNPQTLESITIAARNQVIFKAGNRLKQQLNLA